MSIIEKLASSLGRKDEIPNQELAMEIIASRNVIAVKELVVHLSDQNKNIQSDCIKTLYEIGERAPELISSYVNDFIALLDSKNNRLQWGAMTALNQLTEEQPVLVYGALPKLAEIVEKGSVITRDNYVAVLIKLMSLEMYSQNAFELLLEQLKTCPTNQLPMYAENALQSIPSSKKGVFAQTLTMRLDEIDKESKRKRVEKVIQKVLKSK
jgi:hypothetical protein